ncbi:glycoside hydrolase family 16 protein [Irpex rosettiformis]|uniref:Glycoside hydrolase family 16 protein n=1 Tax=Irpex rosettiformis TaxID=378272 RepID=A0ACB8UMZ7_9APHY|nr:glycoside hydrolase family 16 protein [Irpex rosettiformis]
MAAVALLALASGVSAVSNTLASSQNNTNGSSFVWTISDTYAGNTFFDAFDFFTGPDPTNYTTKDFAFANGLAFVENGTVVMKGDNTSELQSGTFRNSVRISSQKLYNSGLFILDLNKAPWGCGVWPAWWTVGPNWPQGGEIDIIEGVHDNEHNQVTWHTGPNCTLSPNASFTGTVAVHGHPNVVCNGLADGNAGCAIIEWSRASYGPTFDAAGGGVFAMKWDDTGISVWSFYRALVPEDIQAGQPEPDTWGVPVAYLAPSLCNPMTNFVNHSIVFDITFCGDWAGNSYATSGCPGTCSDRLMDPANFVNASWSINHMKVYKRVTLSRPSNGSVSGGLSTTPVFGLILSCVTAIILSLGILSV